MSPVIALLYCLQTLVSIEEESSIALTDYPVTTYHAYVLSSKTHSIGQIKKKTKFVLKYVIRKKEKKIDGNISHSPFWNLSDYIVMK